METYSIKNLTFSYPGKSQAALNNISIDIIQGQFITVCGKSGCGKSTLLRQLKPALAPHGLRSGDIYFNGQPLESVEQRTQAAAIGFVMQSPDHQIVTDKVWHELAFGLESLGYDTQSIRLRVAEMASFFGIQNWFNRKVGELSGGQKQMLNLAAVMTMQPQVLLLDEPTSQLDPIAAADFIATVRKINLEFGTTVILSEHRLEEALPLSDRVLVMDEGGIIADGLPREVGAELKASGHDMFIAMPTPLRVYAAIENDLPCPLTVREGRDWLEQVATVRSFDNSRIVDEAADYSDCQPVIKMTDVWFRYQKDNPDVLKGLNVFVKNSEFFAILGGNATGKTTMLSLLSGINKPYRGRIELIGRDISDISAGERYDGLLGVLPQSPQALFVKNTVELDLKEMLAESKLTQAEQQQRLDAVIELCELAPLLAMHPYDISGGEQQRAALAKVLLLSPKILLLDEPTKGLDAYFKHKFATIIKSLQKAGVTVVMVSHDIEFCAKYADRCALFFDGAIVSEESPRQFFSGNSFYTTAANRMARHLLPDAITDNDIIAACGLTPPKYCKNDNNSFDSKCDLLSPLPDGKMVPHPTPLAKISFKRWLAAGFMTLLFIVTLLLQNNQFSGWVNSLAQFLLVLEVVLIPIILFKQRRKKSVIPQNMIKSDKEPLTKRTIAALIIILIAVPLTIYLGYGLVAERKYYIISTLLLFEAILPFILVFEGRRPQARELVIIAVLCTIGVLGRAAFFMLPQFKPLIAIVIIAGVCFGGESGFLVGALTALISNFFFGQGPWTPWQMLALGLIGFLAGVLFSKRLLAKSRFSLCVFGALTTILIYGGIINPASVLMFQSYPTAEMFLISYIQALPMDLIHAASTVFFLYLIAEPMIEKLERIKIKYGLIEIK